MFDGRTDGSASSSRARWSCSHWPRSRARSLSSPAPTPSTRRRQRWLSASERRPCWSRISTFPCCSHGRASRSTTRPRPEAISRRHSPAARRRSASRGRSPAGCSGWKPHRTDAGSATPTTRASSPSPTSETAALSEPIDSDGWGFGGSDSLVVGRFGGAGIRLVQVNLVTGAETPLALLRKSPDDFFSITDDNRTWARLANGTIEIRDIESGRLLHRLRPAPGARAFSDVNFRARGRYLVVTSLLSRRFGPDVAARFAIWSVRPWRLVGDARRPARELPVHGRRGRKAIRNRASRRLDHDLRSRERQDPRSTRSPHSRSAATGVQ